MHSIPEEITGIRQWTYSYSIEEIKRPTHDKYKPEGALDFLEARNIAESAHPHKLIGFYVTDNDPYILGDLDKIEDPNNPFPSLPPEIGYLLMQKETYSEISPSGKGVRFIFKFMSLEEKKRLTGSTFYTKELTEIKERRGIQVNVRAPWMTFTGNPTAFSAPRVALITIDELSRCFDLKLERKKTPTVPLINKPVEVPIIPFSKLRSEILSLPLDQNPRIRRAYEKTFGTSYDHYDFWMKILMGLSYYAKLSGKEVDCMETACVWSATDTENYESEEDVLKHWNSLRREEETENVVTHGSIIKVAFYNKIYWPIPKIQSEAEKDLNLPPKPLTTEYENFEALVEFYDLKVYSNYLDRSSYFLTGDFDILDKYFKPLNIDIHYEKYYGPIGSKTLVPLFHMFLQKEGFVGIGHNRVQEFVRNWLVTVEGEINLMRLYFDTPFYDLPLSYQDNPQNYTTSSFDKLFECLKIAYKTPNEERERELYYRYYKCWLMGLVRGLYYEGPYKENNCILLLTGIEQIRKTSHFKALLPDFLKPYVAHTTHDFSGATSLRDIVKLATDNLIIVWDELEKYLTRATESLFKNMIDNKPTKFIDKWEVSACEMVPKAIYGATSNQTTFNIGTKGSRRLFHIPVKWVDTDTINELCWHPIIKELREEMFEGLKKKGTLPWLLTKEELQYQSFLHEFIRFKSELEIVLFEVYNFDEEIEYSEGGGINGVASFRGDETGTFKSIKQVITDLSNARINTHRIKYVDLKRALEAACSTYTGTQRYSKHLISPKCTIFKGVAKQGDRAMWVMPPLRISGKESRDEEAQQVFRTSGKPDLT